MRRALLVLALVGCSDPAARCAEAGAARDHETVRAACPEALTGPTADEAATALGHAHLHFADYDAVLALRQRMAGTPAEATLWRVAGKVHERRNDGPAARRAYETALAQHRAQGRPAEVARDAQALAGTYWKTGAYDQAVRHLAVADEAAQAAGDTRLSGFVALARGSVLMQAGDGRGAERAWAEAEAALGEAAPVDRAWIHAKLGYLRLVEGWPALARVELDKAEKLAAGEPRPDLMRAIHLNRAVAALDEDRLDLAGPALDAAEQVLKQAPDAAFRANILFRRAELRYREGEFDEAERVLAEAHREAPVPELTWRLEMVAGLVAAARDRDAEADAAWVRSIEAVEALRRDLHEDDLRAWFLAAKRAPYEALFAARARRGDVAGALAVQERALARMFLDAFVAGADAVTGGEALRALLPVAGAAVAPGAVDEVLGALRDVSALVWFLAEGRWWLTVVERGEARLVPLSADPGALEKLASRMAADPGDVEAAEALGAMLLPPEVVLPAGMLHVVPSAALLRVPLAALRRGGRVLVSDHALVHAPGLTAIAARRHLAETTANAVDRGPRARGDTGPDGHGREAATSDSRGADASAAVVFGDAGGDLPHAAAEAQAVAAHLGVEPLLGAAATAGRLRAAATARVLHVAGHAGMADGGAWLATAGARVDARQIVEWRLRPGLVVLASCASGATPGRDMWGSLASAFLAAGARHVVAAHWSVDDAEARRFVTAFYEAGGAVDPVGGVARAQRRLAQDAPPRVWAPFFVTGG